MPVSVWQASALLRLGHVFRIVCARVRVGSAGGVCLCGGLDLERHRTLKGQGRAPRRPGAAKRGTSQARSILIKFVNFFLTW